MISILLNAYAVSPNHGSEPGVGWNWVIELANYCNVYVITEAEFKNEIVEALQKLRQKDSIHFYYNDIGEKARKMCWNQGDYRFYYYYREWQKETYKIAIEVIKSNKIDIIHQLNMIGYREPGYLWKIKNIPFVWGPIGGFSYVKPSFLSSLGLNNAIFYFFKNIANNIQAVTNSRVHKSINRANLLLAASSDSQKAIKRFFNKKSTIINETGCHINSDVISIRSGNIDEFRILWVGRFIPTKLLHLALQTIQKVKHLQNLKFHIVGTGINDKITNDYKDYSKELGIDDKCIWHNKVSRNKVDEIMRDSDILFFSSIVEGTSHVILESIANNLPILCFDSCGHGEIITNDIGRKIPVTNPRQSAASFAQQIEFLYSNRSILKQLSTNCVSKIHELSWETKGKNMFMLYNNLLKAEKSQS